MKYNSHFCEISRDKHFINSLSLTSFSFNFFIMFYLIYYYVLRENNTAPSQANRNS